MKQVTHDAVLQAVSRIVAAKIVTREQSDLMQEMEDANTLVENFLIKHGFDIVNEHYRPDVSNNFIKKFNYGE